MINMPAFTSTRTPVDHFLSGAIAAAISVGAVNYYYRKKQRITKKEARVNTIKYVIQGSIASGSAIIASNQIAQKNYFSAANTILISVAGVMATEEICEKLNQGEKND